MVCRAGSGVNASLMDGAAGCASARSVRQTIVVPKVRATPLDAHMRRLSNRPQGTRQVGTHPYMVRGEILLPSGLREGDIVAGKYRIGKVIGAGAMGTV